MDYLDAVKLFDRPMLDQNAIRHLIYNLQDRYDQKLKRLWNDHEYHLLERFMHMHKPCGLYSQLILVYDSVDIDTENDNSKDDISFISGSQEVDGGERRVHLNSVRRKYL